MTCSGITAPLIRRAGILGGAEWRSRFPTRKHRHERSKSLSSIDGELSKGQSAEISDQTCLACPSDRWTRFETRAAGRLRRRSRMRARSSSARSRSSDEQTVLTGHGSDSRLRRSDRSVNSRTRRPRVAGPPAHPYANRTFTRIATSRSSGEALLSRRSSVDTLPSKEVLDEVRRLCSSQNSRAPEMSGTDLGDRLRDDRAIDVRR